MIFSLGALAPCFDRLPEALVDARHSYKNRRLNGLQGSGQEFEFGAIRQHDSVAP